MALIRLPPDTPLYSKEPLTLALENGAVVFKGPVTYPTVGVKLKDIEHMTKFAIEDGDPLIPVLVTSDGLHTDLNWWTLVKVQRGVEGRHNNLNDSGWDMERTMEMVAKNQVNWSLKCPVMEGTQSLMGLFMTMHGYHAGAEEDGGAAMKEPSNTVKTHPIKKLLKHASPEEMQTFRDGTDTLLDLAFVNFQWEAAEWLWKNGVRWSQEAIARGKPLEDLAAASLKLRSGYSSFLNPQWSKSTDGQRIQECLDWLEPWLERWEALRAPLPTEAALTRRAQRAKASNWMEATQLRDTPQTFWAARMVEQTGPNIMPLDKLHAHTRAVVDRWLLFWTRQGVDFATLALPSNNTSTRPFTEAWEKAPDWVGHVRRFQAQRLLDDGLPRPGRVGQTPRF